MLILKNLTKNKILVYYQVLSIHPIYSQLYRKCGFISNLSVIDLILNEGPEIVSEFLKKNVTVDRISSVDWVNSKNI